MKNNHALKWITQRITAVLLIPMSFWFIYICFSFQNLNYSEIQLFFRSYLNSFLFLLMMSAMLVHAKLGCETIVEDYISGPKLKYIYKNLINFVAIFSLFLVILAIVKLNII